MRTTTRSSFEIARRPGRPGHAAGGPRRRLVALGRRPRLPAEAEEGLPERQPGPCEDGRRERGREDGQGRAHRPGQDDPGEADLDPVRRRRGRARASRARGAGAGSSSTCTPTSSAARSATRNSCSPTRGWRRSRRSPRARGESASPAKRARLTQRLLSLQSVHLQLSGEPSHHELYTGWGEQDGSRFIVLAEFDPSEDGEDLVSETIDQRIREVKVLPAHLFEGLVDVNELAVRPDADWDLIL